MTETSAAYAAATAAHSAAFATYSKVLAAYRSREIATDEYLEARAAWDAAQDAFDEAFADEENREIAEGERVHMVAHGLIGFPSSSLRVEVLEVDAAGNAWIRTADLLSAGVPLTIAAHQLNSPNVQVSMILHPMGV